MMKDLSPGESVARDGVFISRRGPGEGSLGRPKRGSSFCYRTYKGAPVTKTRAELSRVSPSDTL